MIPWTGFDYGPGFTPLPSSARRDARRAGVGALITIFLRFAREMSGSRFPLHRRDVLTWFLLGLPFVYPGLQARMAVALCLGPQTSKRIPRIAGFAGDSVLCAVSLSRLRDAYHRKGPSGIVRRSSSVRARDPNTSR